jgi:DNA-binding transcriptional LysR family regulator
MDMFLNMKAFLAAAHTGSFSEAARQLGVVPSVVTKRVNQLEARVGGKLFQRSTRRVGLTEVGERYLPKVQRLVSDFDEMVAGIMRAPGELEGHIRVKAPTMLTVMYLGRILSEFQRQHPRVSMDIVLMDRTVNPIEEQFDVAIGAFPVSFAGVVEEPLCRYQRGLFVSPDYLTRRGTPTHPRDLVDHDCIVFLPGGTSWTFDSARGPVNVNVRPHLAANDTRMLLNAAREGHGFCIVSRFSAQADVDARHLVAALPAFPVPELWAKALIPESRVGLARIDALMAWLKAAFAPVPPWEPSVHNQA